MPSASELLSAARKAAAAKTLPPVPDRVHPRFAEASRREVPFIDDAPEDDWHTSVEPIECVGVDADIANALIQKKLEDERAKRMIAERRALQLELQEARRKLQSVERKSAIKAAAKPVDPKQIKRHIIPTYRFEEYPTILIEYVKQMYFASEDMRKIVTRANKFLAGHDMRPLALADLYIMVSQMKSRKMLLNGVRKHMSHELTIRQFNAFFRAWVTGFDRDLCREAAQEIAESGSLNHCNLIFRSLNALARKSRNQHGKQTKSKMDMALIELFSRARLISYGEAEVNGIFLRFSAIPHDIRNFLATILPSQRELFLYPEIATEQRFPNRKSLESAEKLIGNSPDDDYIANPGDLSTEDSGHEAISMKDYELNRSLTVLQKRIEADKLAIAMILKRQQEDNDEIQSQPKKGTRSLVSLIESFDSDSDPASNNDPLDDDDSELEDMDQDAYDDEDDQPAGLSELINDIIYDEPCQIESPIYEAPIHEVTEKATDDEIDLAFATIIAATPEIAMRETENARLCDDDNEKSILEERTVALDESNRESDSTDKNSEASMKAARIEASQKMTVAERIRMMKASRQDHQNQINSVNSTHPNTDDKTVISDHDNSNNTTSLDSEI